MALNGKPKLCECSERAQRRVWAPECAFCPKKRVEYQSSSTIFFNRVKTLIMSIIKPIFAIIIILVGLYVAGYIILLFVIFLFFLFIYNKIKKTI